jgi:hypothetical protein
MTITDIMATIVQFATTIVIGFVLAGIGLAICRGTALAKSSTQVEVEMEFYSGPNENDGSHRTK